MYLRWYVIALCCAVLAGVPAHADTATPVLATAHSIAGGDQTTRVDPVERTLTISTAGIYNLTLTDLKQPSAFSLMTVAITSGATVVGTAFIAAGDSSVVAQINAPVGTYLVHVIAGLATGELYGTAGVQLTDANGNPVNGFAGPGNTMVPGFVAPLSLPPAAVPANARVIDTIVTIATAGTYEFDLSDLQFPAALGGIQAAMVGPSGPPVFSLTSAGTATFAATPGTYHLVAGAQAGSGAEGGLFNLHLFNTGTQTDAFNETDSLGQVASLGTVTLSTGSDALSFTDFSFPTGLAQGTAVAVQAGSIVASTAGGSPAGFVALAGDCQVFALAVPDASAANGTYQVTMAPQGGGAALFTSVQSASTGAGGAAAYAYPVTVPSAGSYALTLADFQFPVAFAGLTAVAEQGGTLLGTPLSGAGTANFTAAAGPMFVLVSAAPGTGGKGALGIELATAGGGASTFEVTQGVGAAFGTTKVTIATSGSYNVTVSDLVFPANFADLAGLVTQGTKRFGSIFGGGTFSIAATPGDYIINVLGTPAKVGSSQQTAGTYGIVVETTPPAPAVTFRASASEVTSGGTVTLTWSSQNSTSCTASGGWEGAKTVSGTEESAALTASTTFTLVCTGGGGSTTQSVMVTLKASGGGGGGGGGSSGGGGSIDLLLLAALGGLWLRSQLRRAT